MPNLCGTILSEAQAPLTAQQEETLTWAAISSVGAGLDTVSSFRFGDFLIFLLTSLIRVPQPR
jgi:hypothetical protein